MLGTNLLVIHPLPLVGPIVAEACGVPWISSVLSPFSLFSAFDPPVGPRMPYLHRLLRLHPRLGELFVWMAKGLTTPFVRPVYRLRADLGLPPGGHPLIEGQHSPVWRTGAVLVRFGAPAARLAGRDGSDRFPLS